MRKPRPDPDDVPHQGLGELPPAGAAEERRNSVSAEMRNPMSTGPQPRWRSLTWFFLIVGIFAPFVGAGVTILFGVGGHVTLTLMSMLFLQTLVRAGCKDYEFGDDDGDGDIAAYGWCSISIVWMGSLCHYWFQWSPPVSFGTGGLSALAVIYGRATWIRLKRQDFKLSSGVLPKPWPLYALPVVSMLLSMILAVTLAVYFGVRGNKLSAQGDIDGAIAAYTTAIETTDWWGLYSRRAGCYVNKGQYDNAVRDWDHVIESSPNEPESYVGRAVALVRKGDKASLDAAVSDCTAAIRMKPGLGIAFFARSKAYRLKGESAKADSNRAEALRLDPDLVNTSEEMKQGAGK